MAAPWRFVGLALALLLATRAAGSDSPGVVLTDGAVLSGTLTRGKAPGSPVRVRTGTEEYEIPADLVAATVPADLPPPPADPEHRLVLRDGGHVAGRILEETEGTIRFRCGNREIEFAREEVVNVLRTAEPAEPDRAGTGRGRSTLFRDPDAAVATLAEPLELSAEQREKTRGAAEEAISRLASARDTMAAGDRAAAVAAYREAINGFRNRMREILTDVQYAKLAGILPEPGASGGR